ncbi:MAG TPA: acylphosphatase [Terriglobales bacterium]|nr:acylphosphatase [Terriglobales bacterium]
MADSVRFEVFGIVQGVGFRAFVEYQAQRLQLHGWVRNRHDGSVEVLATGAVEALGQLEAALHQGPRLAQVERVVRHAAEAGATTGFHIA